MATAKFQVCSICEMRKKTNKATVWCPECEDSLCADCEEHHSISKATKSHTPVFIDDYQKLPPFILDAKMFCGEHNEKFYHYCMNHECLLCKTCIVKAHAACKDMKIIEDVIGNCKSSYAMESIEKDLKKILYNIRLLKQDQQSNLFAFTKQRNTIIKRVSELRSKINQHLDKIEKEFLVDVSSVADKNQKQITDLLDLLTSKEERIDELQKSIGGIKEHASDFQTFIGMKEIEKRINEEKSYIRSILESASLKHIEIYCRFDSSIQNLTKLIKKMGILSVKENPSKIKLNLESAKQAQTKSLVGNSANAPRLTLDHQMSISNETNGEITSCCTLSTGVHVFAFNNILVIYRSDLTFMHNIPLNYKYPTNITQTNSNDTIAVSTGYMKEVLMINISERTILRTINIAEPLYGITFRDGCLIYCAKGIGLVAADIKKRPLPLTSRIYKMNIGLPSFVKVINDKICITDTSNSNVKILGPNMKEIFDSNNQTGLTKPSDITADEFGYIYIADNESPCSVTVLSPSGQQCQSFELNELEYLWGLSYDVTTKRLVVASKGTKVSFYKIHRGII